MKNTTLITFMLGACLILIGCVSQPRITTQLRADADFGNYRTYAWITPLATDKAGYSTIMTSHFKSAVQAQLAARGFTFDPNSPDLLINFFSNVEHRTESYSNASMNMGYFGYRGGYGYGFGAPFFGDSIQTRNYKVGTVSIDVVDAKRKELIWEGALEGTLSIKAMQNPGGAIESAVAQVFSKFPVQAGTVTPVK